MEQYDRASCLSSCSRPVTRCGWVAAATTMDCGAVAGKIIGETDDFFQEMK